ncbi:MAG: ABC transporter substrate-binding protein [Treponemataceae bacterium]
MKKSAFILSVLFVVALLTVGCAKNNDDVIKIGGIFPLSGSVAVYGNEARNGVELAISEINAAGGIDGKQILLIAEDDEGNPEKTVNAYKKLTSRDGVKVIIGSLTSGATASIASIAQAQKIILLAPAATMESITDAGDYIFRACFIDPFQGTVGGKFASDNLQAQRAAVLYDVGNDYSVGLYENFRTSFEVSGGQIVAAESYSTGDKDFNAQLTKIKAANPDVVYLPDYYATVALIAKQLRSQGIMVPIVGGDGWGGITENAGDEMLNSFYSDHYASDSTDGVVREFVDTYRAKYNTKPVSFAALGYDCVFILRDAMLNAASTTDTDAIRSALSDTNGLYVTGYLTFDSRRNPIKSAVMMQIVEDENEAGKLAVKYNTTVNP